MQVAGDGYVADVHGEGVAAQQRIGERGAD